MYEKIKMRNSYIIIQIGYTHILYFIAKDFESNWLNTRLSLMKALRSYKILNNIITVLLHNKNRTKWIN